MSTLEQLVTYPTKVGPSTGGVDPTDALPRELLLRIFSYLSSFDLLRLCAVSRSWYDICYDGSLWHTIDATQYYTRLSSAQLTRLITRSGMYVKDLNLRGCIYLDIFESLGIAKSLSNLLFISLEGSRKFDHNALTQLIKNNSSLTHADFSSLMTLTNASCFTISSSCPNLVSLDVSWCPYCDANGLIDILRSCKFLRDLRVSGCKGVEDESFMCELHHTARHLRRLSMASCTSLTDESMRVLVSGSRDRILVDPVTRCPNIVPTRIQYLNLSYCILLTSQTLSDLAYVVPDLCEFELSGIPAVLDDGFNALIPNTPNLAYLDCEECSQLSDSTLNAIARAECAKVFRHGHFSFCENLTDEGVSNLLKSCPGLKNLELDNTRVTDEVINVAVQVTREQVGKVLGTLQRLVDRGEYGAPRAEDLTGVILRLATYDCPNLTWQSTLGVMRRNEERVLFNLRSGQVACAKKRQQASSSPADSNDGPEHITPAETVLFPTGFIQLKCAYDHQKIIDGHLQFLLMAEFDTAVQLEREFAEYCSGDPDYEYLRYAQDAVRPNLLVGNLPALLNRGGGGGDGPATGQNNNASNNFMLGSIMRSRRRHRRGPILSQVMESVPGDDEPVGIDEGTALQHRRRGSFAGCVIM
ncbi:hypothetical protein V1525DRAFT_401384 [Lipomyces kononenkoae]|uniref:Uncharacterized protein n=1 Tax=Lipomyces kononenkoae TaxID=34357 RepID=A0ACC3T487_LIPKO